jgi:hypothetical protein
MENQLQKGSSELSILKISQTKPLDYWKTTEVSTVKQAFNSQSSSLVSIKLQENGENIAKAFLVVIITDLANSFNVVRPMSAQQIAFTVQSVLKDFYYLKIDELKLCFENAKKGKYAKIYDRLDTALIYEFIDSYLSERLNAVYEQNIEAKKMNNLGTMHPDVAAKLKDLFKDEDKTKQTNTPIKYQNDDEWQKYLVEFGKLQISNPVEHTKGLFVYYQDKMFNHSEYCEQRYREENI